MLHDVLPECDAIRATSGKDQLWGENEKQRAFFHPNLLCCPQTSRKYRFSLNQAKAY